MTSVVIPLVVTVLATLLPKFGVTVGSEALTTTVQTLVVLASSLYAYFAHKKVVTAARAGGIPL